MKKSTSILFVILILLGSVKAHAQGKQFKALLITKTAGWHHESIPDGVAAMKALADRNYFDLVWHQEAAKITDKYLEEYQVLIFLNTTGHIFDTSEQRAIERFIQAGKGFVGIHSASDTEYGWEWYTKLVGRMFVTHPPVQTARLQLTSHPFPGLQGFSGGPLWTDEWYELTEEKTNGLNYILAVDESSYQADVKNAKTGGKGMGAFHPIAWFHDFDGGRAFYTALGHLPAVYRDPAFLQHIYAGIYWAATGKK